VTTRPTKPQRWPNHADAIRKQAIELAEDGGELLDDARAKAKAGHAKLVAGYAAIDALQNKNERREHPALVALDAAKAQRAIAEGQREYAEAERDIADAMRYLADIKRVLTEARIGVD